MIYKEEVRKSMKIEKLNDQQIRCTLTKEDLAVRHIKLSELAYGTEKTRELFRDMMEQASADFGFEVEDIPLMVEAIPMSSEQIVLIITKVESPDELDTRFSEFSQYWDSEEEPPAESEADSETGLDLPEELLAMLRKVKQELTESGECPAAAAERSSGKKTVCLFTFSEMGRAIPAAKTVAPLFCGNSALYREASSGEYLLFLHQGEHSPMEFSRICHTMTAYLDRKKGTLGKEAYCREHENTILAEQAVETLAKL